MGHEQFQTVEYILFIVKCVHEYVGITKIQTSRHFFFFRRNSTIVGNKSGQPIDGVRKK